MVSAIPKCRATACGIVRSRRLDLGIDFDLSKGCEPIRTYRRYHRLIDRSPRVWFHTRQEDSMKPLERPAHRVAVRAGIIVFAAMTVLALSSALVRRMEPAMH